MTLLELAKKKFDNRKYNKIRYDGKTFREFVMECYLNIDPSTYGKLIQNMLQEICNDEEIELSKIKDTEDCGDLRIQVPSESWRGKYFIYTDQNGEHHNIKLQHYIDIFFKLDWEFKVSFLGKNDGYTVRNIRPYQKINGGYILCLIDCENDFEEEFYVITQDVIFNHFSLSNMNGTKKQHVNNNFKNLGTAFKKDSYEHRILKEKNKLEGTSIEHLISYFKINELKLNDEFCKTKECQNYIKELNNLIYSASINLNNIKSSYDISKKREYVLNLLSSKKKDRVVDIILIGPYGKETDIDFTIKGYFGVQEYYDSIYEQIQNDLK